MDLITLDGKRLQLVSFFTFSAGFFFLLGDSQRLQENVITKSKDVVLKTVNCQAAIDIRTWSYSSVCSRYPLRLNTQSLQLYQMENLV